MYHRLLELLDTLQPAALDVERSSVGYAHDQLNAVLEHRAHPGARIDLGYGGGSGTIFGAAGHEEYYGTYEEGPLDEVMLDDLGRLLRNTYEVDEVWWRGRMVRRISRGPHFAAEGQVHAHVGWLIAPVRLLPRRGLERRHYVLTWDCRGN